MSVAFAARGTDSSEKYERERERGRDLRKMMGDWMVKMEGF